MNTITPYTGPIQDGTTMAIVIGILIVAVIFIADMRGTLIIGLSFAGVFYSGIGLAVLDYIHSLKGNAFVYAVGAGIVYFLIIKPAQKNNSQQSGNSAPAPQRKGQP